MKGTKLSYTPAKTVQKALNILEMLAEAESLHPSDLARELGLSRSNVYRLLASLEAMGYVEKMDSSRFGLSFKVFMLGSNISRRNQILRISHPIMSRLAKLCHENINLAIMYRQKALYIDQIESPHPLKLNQPVGKTDPLHCTALGKALLSGLSGRELEAFLRSNKLISYTKNTIADPESLIAEIQKVKKRGYAMDIEETHEGIHCIAVPILDNTNKVIAALSISAPSVRLTKQQMRKLRIPLINTSKEISKRWAGIFNPTSFF